MENIEIRSTTEAVAVPVTILSSRAGGDQSGAETQTMPVAPGHPLASTKQLLKPKAAASTQPGPDHLDNETQVDRVGAGQNFDRQRMSETHPVRAVDPAGGAMPPAAKKRGRPVGSRNRPKAAAAIPGHELRDAHVPTAGGQGGDQNKHEAQLGYVVPRTLSSAPAWTPDDIGPARAAPEAHSPCGGAEPFSIRRRRAADQRETTIRDLKPVAGASSRAPNSDRQGDFVTRTAGAVGRGGGQDEHETHVDLAPAATKSRRQDKTGTRDLNAAGGDGQDHSIREAQSPAVLPSPLHSTDPVIAEIVQLHRMRRRWMKARNALILQGKAFGRALKEGDKTAGSALYAAVADGTCTDPVAIMAITPFADGAKAFDVQMTAIEKTLTKLAKRLPVAPWVEAMPGLGFGSLAALVGEAGDIGQYRTVSGLWKRMGVAVINGERQRMVKSEEMAMVHGYSPSRRSILWNVGGSLIGGMGRGPRPFVDEDIEARDDWTPLQRLFVARMRYEAARDPDKHRRDPVKDPKTGRMRESFSAHAAARAKRVVEKKFLALLWSAWRAAALGRPEPVTSAPPPELLAAE